MRGKLYIVDRDYHDYRERVKSRAPEQPLRPACASIMLVKTFKTSWLAWALLATAIVLWGQGGRRGGGFGGQAPDGQNPGGQNTNGRGNQNQGQNQGQAGQEYPSRHPAARVRGRPRHEHHRRAASKSLADPASQRTGRRKLCDHQRGRRQFSLSHRSIKALTRSPGRRTGYVRETLSTPGGQTQVDRSCLGEKHQRNRAEADAPKRDRRGTFSTRTAIRSSPSTSKCGAIRTRVDAGNSRRRRTARPTTWANSASPIWLLAATM